MTRPRCRRTAGVGPPGSSRPSRSPSACAPRRPRPGRAADDQRQAVLREAGARRPRLHERVQRHVLRREDGRHRDHPPRRPDGHRRRGPPEPHARAVGPDPEGRGPEGRPEDEHHRGDAALRGVRLRLAPRRDAGRRRLQGRGVPRQARARRARGPRGAQPRVRAVAVLGAHVPDGRQARHLPALPGGPDHVPPAREEDPAVRGALHVRPPRPRGLRRGAADRRGEDPRDGARGPRAPRHDPVPVGRAAAPRRPQPRPERLVRRADAAGDEDHRQGRRVVRRAAHDPELDPHARHRLLAGGLPPLAAEARRHRAGRERHAAGDGLAHRDPARRRAGREDEGEGRAVGQVPPLRLRRGRLLVGQGPGPLPDPVRDAEDRLVPDRGRRVRAGLAPDARRVLPGPDGPHARERGLPRVARRRAPRRRGAGAPERAALRRLPDGRRRPTPRTSRASGSRAWRWAAGSTRATSTSRAGRTR